MNESLIRNITHIFVVQNLLIKCKKKKKFRNEYSLKNYF